MNFSLQLEKGRDIKKYIKEYYEKNMLDSFMSYQEFEDTIMLMFKGLRDYIEKGDGDEIYIKYLGSWKIYYTRVFAIVKDSLKFKPTKFYSYKDMCKRITPHVKVLIKHRKQFEKIKKEAYYELIKDLNKTRKKWLNS